MNSVVLKDFEVVACHGVNPEEKNIPQRFLFTVKLDVDFTPAAKTDDIERTVNYAQVKKAVKAFAEQNCFNLIETLADRLAILLLDGFPLACGVEVTVKKPDAPMSGNFDYVAAVANRRWETVYLGLGSNEGDRDAYLDLAVAMLCQNKAVKDVRESERMRNAPYGGVATGEFVNSAVECRTYLTPLELLDFAHKIEDKGDRVRRQRWGDRTLDVDILLYGDRTVNLPQLQIPHRDMLNRNFVIQPLKQLMGTGFACKFGQFVL